MKVLFHDTSIFSGLHWELSVRYNNKKDLKCLASCLNVMTGMNYCSPADNSWWLTTVFSSSRLETASANSGFTAVSSVHYWPTIICWRGVLSVVRFICQLCSAPQCSWLHLNPQTNGAYEHLIAVLHSAAGAVVAVPRSGGPGIVELCLNCRYCSYTNDPNYVGKMTYA